MKTLARLTVAGILLLIGIAIGQRSTEAKIEAAWARLQSSPMTDTDTQEFDDAVKALLKGGN